MNLFKLSTLFGTLTVHSISAILAAPPVVSETSLLEEMIERETLARLPNPAYTTQQFSSYDRKSVNPKEAGWYSNDDWSMFVRTETQNGRTEHVMMDTKGPGSIVRLWMTFAGPDCGKGTLRIYIDNNPTPVIEAPAMELLSGGIIAPEPLSASVSKETPYERRGHNLYYPIPYAKQCKVTYESPNVYTGTNPEKRKGSENVYYNIECRTYTEPVEIIPFTNCSDHPKKIEHKVAHALADMTTDAEKIKDHSTLYIKESLHPDQSTTLKIDGGQAIRDLKIHINASNLPQALRSTVISMKFDGEQTVWVPIGDFFGIGYKMIPSATYFTQTDGKGTLRSFWVMPFEHNCEIAIHNFGTQDVALTGRIIHTPWKWDDQSLHFGASWHQYSNYKTGYSNHSTPQDIIYTNLIGTGRYVGDCLTLYNTVNGWWGEGDEKIYIDNENFPIHFGTGTEDYYGYAWCRPEPFTNHPYISMPSGSGNLGIGNTVNCRFRTLDAIPFSHTLRFDMEIWHWQEAKINYAPTTFWYMRPGGRCTILPDTTEVRRPVAIKRSDIIPPILSAGIEGEDCEIREVTGGKVYGQNRANGLWSQNTQLFWHDAPIGSQLSVSFESPIETIAEMKVICSMAIDYGIFRVLLNGKKLIDKLNLYSPELIVREIPLGNVYLREGTNILTIEAMAPAYKFEKCFFGLDRINIQPIKDNYSLQGKNAQ